MAEIHDNEISTPSGSTAPDPLGGSYPAGSYPTTTGVPATGDSGSKTDEAKQKTAAAAGQAQAEAGNVKEHAVAAAGDVTQQAVGELSSLKDEAKQEAVNLAGEARDRIGSQVETSAKQFASALTGVGQQLTSMAHNSEKQGPLTDVVRQLGQRVESTATRLESGGVQSVTNDITRFARNKPGTFLLACAGAGFLVGRMLRNTDTQSITQAAKGDQTGDPYAVSGLSRSDDLYARGTTTGGPASPSAADAAAYAASMAGRGSLAGDEFTPSGTGYGAGGGIG